MTLKEQWCYSEKSIIVWVQLPFLPMWFLTHSNEFFDFIVKS